MADMTGVVGGNDPSASSQPRTYDQIYGALQQQEQYKFNPREEPAYMQHAKSQALAKDASDQYRREQLYYSITRPEEDPAQRAFDEYTANLKQAKEEAKLTPEEQSTLTEKSAEYSKLSGEKYQETYNTWFPFTPMGRAQKQLEEFLASPQSEKDRMETEFYYKINSGAHQAAPFGYEDYLRGVARGDMRFANAENQLATGSGVSPVDVFSRAMSNYQTDVLQGNPSSRIGQLQARIESSYDIPEIQRLHNEIHGILTGNSVPSGGFDMYSAQRQAEEVQMFNTRESTKFYRPEVAQPAEYNPDNAPGTQNLYAPYTEAWYRKEAEARGEKLPDNWTPPDPRNTQGYVATWGSDPNKLPGVDSLIATRNTPGTPEWYQAELYNRKIQSMQNTDSSIKSYLDVDGNKYNPNPENPNTGYVLARGSPLSGRAEDIQVIYGKMPTVEIRGQKFAVNENTLARAAWEHKYGSDVVTDYDLQRKYTERTRNLPIYSDERTIAFATGTTGDDLTRLALSHDGQRQDAFRRKVEAERAGNKDLAAYWKQKEIFHHTQIDTIEMHRKILSSVYHHETSKGWTPYATNPYERSADLTLQFTEGKTEDSVLYPGAPTLTPEGGGLHQQIYDAHADKLKFVDNTKAIMQIGEAMGKPLADNLGSSAIPGREIYGVKWKLAGGESVTSIYDIGNRQVIGAELREQGELPYFGRSFVDMAIKEYGMVAVPTNRTYDLADVGTVQYHGAPTEQLGVKTVGSDVYLQGADGAWSQIKVIPAPKGYDALSPADKWAAQKRYESEQQFKSDMAKTRSAMMVESPDYITQWNPRGLISLGKNYIPKKEEWIPRKLDYTKQPMPDQSFLWTHSELAVTQLNPTGDLSKLSAEQRRTIQQQMSAGKGNVGQPNTYQQATKANTVDTSFNNRFDALPAMLPAPFVTKNAYEQQQQVQQHQQQAQAWQQWAAEIEIPGTLSAYDQQQLVQAKQQQDNQHYDFTDRLYVSITSIPEMAGGILQEANAFIFKPPEPPEIPPTQTELAAERANDKYREIYLRTVPAIEYDKAVISQFEKTYYDTNEGKFILPEGASNPKYIEYKETVDRINRRADLIGSSFETADKLNKRVVTENIASGKWYTTLTGGIVERPQEPDYGKWTTAKTMMREMVLAKMGYTPESWRVMGELVTQYVSPVAQWGYGGANFITNPGQVVVTTVQLGELTAALLLAEMGVGYAATGLTGSVITGTGGSGTAALASVARTAHATMTNPVAQGVLATIFAGESVNARMSSGEPFWMATGATATEFSVGAVTPIAGIALADAGAPVATAAANRVSRRFEYKSAYVTERVQTKTLAVELTPRQPSGMQMNIDITTRYIERDLPSYRIPFTNWVVQFPRLSNYNIVTDVQQPFHVELDAAAGVDMQRGMPPARQTGTSMARQVETIRHITETPVDRMADTSVRLEHTVTIQEHPFTAEEMMNFESARNAGRMPAATQEWIDTQIASAGTHRYSVSPTQVVARLEPGTVSREIYRQNVFDTYQEMMGWINNPRGSTSQHVVGNVDIAQYITGVRGAVISSTNMRDSYTIRLDRLIDELYGRTDAGTIQSTGARTPEQRIVNFLEDFTRTAYVTDVAGDMPVTDVEHFFEFDYRGRLIGRVEGSRTTVDPRSLLDVTGQHLRQSPSQEISFAHTHPRPASRSIGQSILYDITHPREAIRSGSRTGIYIRDRWQNIGSAIPSSSVHAASRHGGNDISASLGQDLHLRGTPGGGTANIVNQYIAAARDVMRISKPGGSSGNWQDITNVNLELERIFDPNNPAGYPRTEAAYRNEIIRLMRRYGSDVEVYDSTISRRSSAAVRTDQIPHGITDEIRAELPDLTYRHIRDMVYKRALNEPLVEFAEPLELTNQPGFGGVRGNVFVDVVTNAGSVLVPTQVTMLSPATTEGVLYGNNLGQARTRSQSWVENPRNLAGGRVSERTQNREVGQNNILTTTTLDYNLEGLTNKIESGRHALFLSNQVQSAAMTQAKIPQLRQPQIQMQPQIRAQPQIQQPKLIQGVLQTVMPDYEVMRKQESEAMKTPTVLTVVTPAFMTYVTPDVIQKPDVATVPLLGVLPLLDVVTVNPPKEVPPKQEPPIKPGEPGIIIPPLLPGWYSPGWMGTGYGNRKNRYRKKNIVNPVIDAAYLMQIGWGGAGKNVKMKKEESIGEKLMRDSRLLTGSRNKTSKSRRKK